MTRTGTPRAESPPALTIPAIPKQDVLGRLAALPGTSTTKLKDQWRSLFGAEPPPYSRKFLESRLAYRIQELAYGRLKPETVARLEALGSRSTARTSRCVASGRNSARSPAPVCCGNGGASSTS